LISSGYWIWIAKKQIEKKKLVVPKGIDYEYFAKEWEEKNK